MKLLVCVSQTPDTTTKIKFANGDTEFDTNGVQFIMNPYDEWYALVRALELKNKSVERLHFSMLDQKPTRLSFERAWQLVLIMQLE